MGWRYRPLPVAGERLLMGVSCGTQRAKQSFDPAVQKLHAAQIAFRAHGRGVDFSSLQICGDGSCRAPAGARQFSRGGE